VIDFFNVFNGLAGFHHVLHQDLKFLNVFKVLLRVIDFFNVFNGLAVDVDVMVKLLLRVIDFF